MVLSFVDLGVLLAKKAKSFGASLTKADNTQDDSSVVNVVLGCDKNVHAQEVHKADRLRTDYARLPYRVYNSKETDKYKKLKELIDKYQLKHRLTKKQNVIKVQYIVSDIRVKQYTFENIKITTEINHNAALGLDDKLLKLKFSLQFQPVNTVIKYTVCDVCLMFYKNNMTMTLSTDQPDIDVCDGTLLKDIRNDDIDYLFGNTYNHRQRMFNFSLNLDNDAVQYMQDIINVMVDDIESRETTEDYSGVLDSILASALGKIFTFWQNGLHKNKSQYNKLFRENIYLLLFAKAVKQLQSIYC